MRMGREKATKGQPTQKVRFETKKVLTIKDNWKLFFSKTSKSSFFQHFESKRQKTKIYFEFSFQFGHLKNFFSNFASKLKNDERFWEMLLFFRLSFLKEMFCRRFWVFRNVFGDFWKQSLWRHSPFQKNFLEAEISIPWCFFFLKEKKGKFLKTLIWL